MTTTEIEKYFNYHNYNMRLLKIGFEQIKGQLKNIYKTKDKSGNYIYQLNDLDPEKVKTRQIEKALSRILSGIQVSWAEESIKRLLYEKNLLTDVQRTFLIERPALDQKWYAALKLIFCIAYDLVPASDETCQTVEIEDQRWNLGNELVDQYLELKRLITDHLVPSFSIRNKVQHGEWEYGFKPKYSAEFSHELTCKINKENIVTTTSRHILINALYQLIVDLGRFKSNKFSLDSMTTPFEYYYKRYLRKIKFEIVKIDTPNLELYILDMVQKEIRGIAHRNAK